MYLLDEIFLGKEFYKLNVFEFLSKVIMILYVYEYKIIIWIYIFLNIKVKFMWINNMFVCFKRVIIYCRGFDFVKN